MKPDQDLSTFFLAFMGQEITITIDLMGSVTSSSEHGTVTESYPIFYDGILLDESPDHYFLGKPNEITQAVPKSRVVHIKVNDGDKEIIEELFNQIPKPENENEIN